MPSLNLREEDNRADILSKKPPLCPQGIFCWNFSAAPPCRLSLELQSSPGQPMGTAVLSPLTTSTQHIPRLNSDLWGQVRSPPGLSPCTSSTHCTGMGLVCICHTKAESCWKAELSPHSGLAHDKSGVALRQKEKAPLECNCVLNYLKCCYFPFFVTIIIFHISSVRWIICHIYLFLPQTRGIWTTDSKQVLGRKTLKEPLVTREKETLERIICTELSLGFQTSIYRFGRSQEQKL